MNKFKKVKGKLIYWTENMSIVSDHSIWVENINCPGYRFSPEGGCLAIKSGSPKLLTPNQKKNGYTQFALTNNGKTKHVSGHRVIAEIFCKKEQHHTQVNHKNGIKNDNRADNLEWVTASENKRHSLDVLKRPILRGSQVGGHILTESDVLKIKKRLLTKEFHKNIAKDFDVTRECLSSINQGKTWGHVTTTGGSNVD